MAPVAVLMLKAEPAVGLHFLLFSLKQPVQYFLKAPIEKKKENSCVHSYVRSQRMEF